MSVKRVSLTNLNIAIVFGSLMTTCVSPFVTVTLLTDYDASPGLIGTLAILPQVGILTALPLIVFLRNINFKIVSIALVAICRTLIFLIPCVMLWSAANRYLPRLVVAVLAVAAILGVVSNGTTQAWFKAIIPRQLLGRFLGLRNTISFLMIAGLTPAVGWFLGSMPAWGFEKADKYLVIFSLALAGGFLDLLFLARAEPCATPPATTLPRALYELKRYFRDRRLLQPAWIYGVGELGLGFMLPYQLLLLYHLGLNTVQVAWIAAIQTVALGLGYFLGGRPSDRGLIRDLLVSSTALRATLCFLMAVLVWLYADCLLPMSCLFGGLAALGSLFYLLAGMSGIAYGKLSFESIRTPSSLAFMFIDFLRGAVLGLPVGAAMVWLGARIIERNDALQAAIGASFHYSQLLFLLSAIGGGLSAWWLNRSRLWQDDAAPAAARRPIDIPELIAAIHFINPFRLLPGSRRPGKLKRIAP